MRVLLIAFDAREGNIIKLTLRQRWPEAEIVGVGNGEQGLAHLQEMQPNLVLASMTLPDMDGLSLLQKIRAYSDAVLVALDSDGNDTNLVAALEAGADDYLRTPIVGVQLVARVGAALRRAGRPDGQSELAVRCGDLQLNLATYEACLGGTALYLTPTEFKLLYHLAKNSNRIVSSTALERLVWGSDDRFSVDSLRKYIQRLRRKLQAAPGKMVRIETAPRYGYKLTESA